VRKSIHSRDYGLFLRLLREARSSAGISQVQLARAIGETQSTVSKIERGERRLDLIEARTICRALGCSFPRFVARLDRELRSS
jgi:transcriptional regulator with XRE-family HTH domain